MKRIVSVLMTGLLLTTCTNAIAFAQEQNYQELIRFLNEGNYDAAHEYIDKLEEAGSPQESETDIIESNLSQASSTEDIMEIELTPDNFKDYFDIVFSDTETYMDAFDEEVSNYSNIFIFVNKAYNDGLVFLGTNADFAIEIDFQYLQGIQEGNIDIEFNGDALKAPIHSFSHYDSEDISITDFSVLRSKGTVFFTKEAAVEHFELTENIPAPEGYEVYSAWSSVNSDLGAVNFVKTINQ